MIEEKTKVTNGAELRYATRLAVYLWETHWRAAAPDWKPQPDLIGVLTQIDNMIANLKASPKSAPLGSRSLPSGESYPVVTLDCGGADAMKKGLGDIGKCLDIISDWDRHGSIDHSLAFELHTKLKKVWVALSTVSK